MADLPTGTVTFLLTDIEGSTLLWEREPVAMRQAAVRHDALIEAAVAEHSGVVVRPRGEGDSRFAVFARASDAVAAALALQWDLAAEPWPTSTPLRVRVALHTGEADVRDGDYYGTAVNRCARLRAVAHGAQVLVSQATAELVRDTLPSGASLQDLGEHRLRDLTRPERIHHLLQPGVSADFPPLRSLDTVPHNLPVQLTSFVGRERELAEIAGLLANHRLVTLTGAGGCGKTRLALQAAADRLDATPDGVWLVELASLSDPELVPQVVAQATGIVDQPGQPLLTTLIGALAGRRLLLVLDNCEHLLDASATLVEALLRGCPGLRVLATSRELLGAAGEVSWRVPSMTTPDPQLPPSLGQLLGYEAVQLFAERARLVQPTFAVTNTNAAAVARICHRLDGVSLALELAAARVTALSAEQIAARLDDRFRLLTGGRRTALRRQQTLQAAIDWSHDLLTEPERVLLRRLAVFAGGWTLEAAEAVGAGNDIAAWEVVDLLSRLVEKSLVLGEDQGVATRYRLLETTRQYASDKLVAAGEAVAVRDRHGDWYLALAEEAEPELGGPRRGDWLDRLERESDNLRAALDWYEASDQIDRALRLAGVVGLVWTAHGYVVEGRQRLARLLALPGAAAPTLARVNALYAAERLATLQDDRADIHAFLEEGLAIARQLGDQPAILRGINRLAWRYGLERNFPRARELAEQALALARDLDDPRGRASALYTLNLETFDRRDFATSRALYAEILPIYRDLGDQDRIANVLNDLGLIAWLEGDGRAGRAYQVESLTMRWQLRDVRGVTVCLDCLAGLAATQEQPARAARLAGAVAAVRARHGLQPPAFWSRLFADAHAQTRQELGEDAFAAAWAAGQALTLEEAIAEALADAPTS